MRKLLILLITAFIFTSCASLESLPGSKTFTGYDFSKYSNQGFLFTPESYEGNYKSIGMVNVTFWPEVKKQGDPLDSSKNYSVTRTYDTTWFIEKLNMQTAIDSMYSKASKMGADAVIRFNTNYQTKQHGSLSIIGLEVSGFAIDRKNN